LKPHDNTGNLCLLFLFLHLTVDEVLRNGKGISIVSVTSKTLTFRDAQLIPIQHEWISAADQGANRVNCAPCSFEKLTVPMVLFQDPFKCIGAPTGSLNKQREWFHHLPPGPSGVCHNRPYFFGPNYHQPGSLGIVAALTAP
jgi:hypothetical protein